MISVTSFLQELAAVLTVAGALILFQIVVLDGIMSVDNGAVLGTLVRHLPSNQRRRALMYGIVGAIVGRGVMLVGAKYIIEHPTLRLIGAGYLLLLFWNHLKVGPKWLHPDLVKLVTWLLGKLFGKNTQTSGFWPTVIQVELTDLAFSLDNVVAIVALTSNFALVIVGVCISILLMRFSASLYSGLVEKVPALEHGAFLVIGFIGGRMISEQLLGFEFPDVAQFAVSMTILVVCGIVGFLMIRKQSPVEEVSISD